MGGSSRRPIDDGTPHPRARARTRGPTAARAGLTALYLRPSLSFLLAITGCGGAPPPPAAAAEPPKPVANMAVASELGTIDQSATEAAFRRLEQPLQDCHRRGMKRLRFLGGDVQFFLRVGSDGKAKSASLEQSTLGDLETERCMLSLVANADWPKPQGGDAEVRKKMGFDPPPDVRRPVDWPAGMLDPFLRTAHAELGKCGPPAPPTSPGRRRPASTRPLADDGPWRITAYVVAKGRRGEIRSAGLSAPSPGASARAECVVKALKALRMPSPGARVAKVSFVL